MTKSGAVFRRNRSDESLKFILDNQPGICFLDGPSTYHPKVTASDLETIAERLMKMIEPVPRVVVDHHFLRDKKWQEWWTENVDNEASCVADFIGIAVENLEAQRKELHEDHPCSRDLYKGLQESSSGVMTLLETTVKQLSSWSYWEKLMTTIRS
ncbi:MAG: hypothetical protein ACXAEU_09485 [Candidatus Hodarchaeales archaeon]|jgi:predicted metallo-beta-lactamase superfamily hydrolase